MKQFSLIFAAIAGAFGGLAGVCWAEQLWEKSFVLFCIGLMSFITAELILYEKHKKQIKEAK